MTSLWREPEPAVMVEGRSADRNLAKQNQPWAGWGWGHWPLSLLTCNLHPGRPCHRQTPTGGQREKSLVMPSVKVSLPDSGQGQGSGPQRGTGSAECRRGAVHRGCGFALNWTEWRNGFPVKGTARSRPLALELQGSLPAYLGEWISRFRWPLGAWVTHRQEELSGWCLLSVPSCNYILHLLRASRPDCESWGGVGGGVDTAAFCCPRPNGNSWWRPFSQLAWEQLGKRRKTQREKRCLL